MIAMDLAANATPDGYTLMSATTAIILHGVLKKVSYDILRAYAPIAKMTTQMYMLVVIPSLPIKSVKELIAYAKSNPGALNYGSSGIGSVQHVSMERFKLMAGVNMVHVPYKGGGAAHLDLLSGRIQVMAPTVISVSTALKSGRLRAIAVTGAHRMQAYPDLPTVSESGVPGFESTNMYGLFAPARTPPAIISALNREVGQIMGLPELKQTLAADGIEAAAPSTPEEFKDNFAKEFNQWEKFFKESKLKL